jgi:hypothetical protein
MGIEEIRKANRGLAVRDIADPALAPYGKLHAPEGFSSLAALADRITGIDPDANRYVASVPELEADPSAALLGLPFGFADIQVGYCNGPNSRLNGLEWHKSAEVDIAVTDLVLLLGKRSDIGSDGCYDSRKLECFYLPKGTAIELYPEVLHFSPCKVESGGFKSVIVLPRGTNGTLTSNELAVSRNAVAFGNIEPRLLFMRNKWLVAHPDRTILVERGAFPGIRGENIEIRL